MKKIQNIDFSYNWNEKLNCKAFTTIRLSDRFEIGDHLNVLLKKELRLNARVVNKHYFTLDKLSDTIAYLDTGYSKEETIDILQKMYKNVDLTKAKFVLYVLLKVDLTDEDYRKKWFGK
jgi:hypothetical protein